MACPVSVKPTTLPVYALSALNSSCQAKKTPDAPAVEGHSSRAWLFQRVLLGFVSFLFTDQEASHFAFPIEMET